MPENIPGTGSGGGFTLGPIQNVFTGADRTAAEAARDLYDTNNPGWIANYNADTELNIRLEYVESGNQVALFQVRNGAGDTWLDNSSAIGVAGMDGGASNFATITKEGQVPSLSSDLVNYEYAGATKNPVTGEWTFDDSIEVPQASIKMSDPLAISEATSELFVHDNVTDTSSVGILSVIDGDSGSSRLIFNQLPSGQTIVAQPDFSQTLTANPLVVPLSATFSNQTDKVTIKTGAAMTNFRAIITDNLTGIVVKYIPSKSVWTSGVGGLDLRLGDNTIDFNSEAVDDPANGLFYIGFTPLRQFAGQASTFTMEADSVNILGNIGGIPYIENEIHFIETVNVPTTKDVTNVSDAYMRLNNEYVTASGTPTGVVATYLATSTADVLTSAQFTAGVDGVSNATVFTDGSDTFAQKEFVQISGTVLNDGLFEVEDHTGTLLTVRGVGTVATVEDFTATDFITTVDSGTITKVNVSVMRSNAAGSWESGTGNESGIVFEGLGDVSTSAPLTANAILLGNGSKDIKVDPNFEWDDGDLILRNASPASSTNIFFDDDVGGIIASVGQIAPLNAFQILSYIDDILIANLGSGDLTLSTALGEVIISTAVGDAVKVDPSGDAHFIDAVETPYGGIGTFQNLLKYSEELDNAYWVDQTAVTIVDPDTVLAPNGEDTGDGIAFTGTTVGKRAAVTLSNGATYSLSFWGRSAVGNPDLIFELGGGGPETVTLGTGNLERYNISITAGADDWLDMSAAAASSDFELWGFQLSIGPGVKPYLKTMDNAVTSTDYGLAISGNVRIQGNINSTGIIASGPTGNEGIFVEADGSNSRIRSEFNQMTLSTSRTADDIIISPNDIPAMRFDSDNQRVTVGSLNAPDSILHVFNASAGTVTARADTIVTIENNTSAFLNFLTPNGEAKGIVFGEESDNNTAGIYYDTSGIGVDSMVFTTNGDNVGMVLNENQHLMIGAVEPISPLHVHENTANIGVSAGINIQQAGSGDAALTFETPSRGWTTGIDQSDENIYRITDSTGKITFELRDSSGGIVLISDQGTAIGAISNTDDTTSLLSISNIGTNAGAFNLHVGDRDPSGNVLGTGGTYQAVEDGVQSSLYLHKGASSTNSDWYKVSVNPSNTIEIHNSAEFEALASGGVITLTEATNFIFRNSTPISTTTRIDAGANDIFMTAEGRVGVSIIYTGSGTFLTSNGANFVILESFDGMINGGAGEGLGTFLNVSNLSEICIIDRCAVVGWGNLGSFTDVNKVRIPSSGFLGVAISGFTFTNCSALLLSGDLSSTVDLSASYYNITAIDTSGEDTETSVRVEGADSILKSGESLVSVSPIVTMSSRVIVSQNSLGGSGSLFAPLGADKAIASIATSPITTGTAFTAQSTLHGGDATQFATSTTNNLVVGQTVVIAGTTNYNGEHRVIATNGTTSFDIGVDFAGDDGAGTYLADAIQITSTAHGLANNSFVKVTETPFYNAFYEIFNVATDTFEVSETFIDTSTGTASVATSLDESDPRVNASGNPGARQSENIGSVIINANAQTTTISTIDTWTDFNLNGLALLGSNAELWRITNRTTGELEYLGLNDFTGVANANVTSFSVGGSQQFEFRVAKNGSPLVDGVVSGREMGGDAGNLSIISPITAVKGDLFRLQVQNIDGTSNVTIRNLSFQIQ